MKNEIVAISSLLSLAALWIGVFWLYPKYCLAAFRQKMFALRDGMFDDARAGRISFDDNAYGIMRVMANGCIRYAHLLNLAQFLFFVFSRKEQQYKDEKFAQSLSASLDELPAEKRKIYTAYMRNFHRLTLSYILLSSPMLAATLLVPIVTWLAIRNFMDQLLTRFESPLRDIDKLAYVAGDAQ